jgi:hypothetical protein
MFLSVSTKQRLVNPQFFIRYKYIRRRSISTLISQISEVNYRNAYLFREKIAVKPWINQVTGKLQKTNERRRLIVSWER